jgi:hypothetical protein
VDDKVFCIKSSREKYPDVLAKYDSRAKTSNIGPKISIEELLSLRERENIRCNKDRTLRLPKYKEYLEKECKKQHLSDLENW